MYIYIYIFPSLLFTRMIRDSNSFNKINTCCIDRYETRFNIGVGHPDVHANSENDKSVVSSHSNHSNISSDRQVSGKSQTVSAGTLTFTQIPDCFRKNHDLIRQIPENYKAVDFSLNLVRSSFVAVLVPMLLTTGYIVVVSGYIVQAQSATVF